MKHPFPTLKMVSKYNIKAAWRQTLSTSRLLSCNILMLSDRGPTLFHRKFHMSSTLQFYEQAILPVSKYMMSLNQ